jgi:hypothetical protein
MSKELPFKNPSVMFDNVAIMGNAVDIAVEITNKVSGNMISNHLDGVAVNDRTLSALYAAEINNAIEGRGNA